MSRADASARRKRRAATRTVIIRDERGLHARAAARMVEVAGRYAAEITVSRGGQTVSGRSILGLMMLAAAPESELMLSAKGPQAKEALEALGRLIESHFQED